MTSIGENIGETALSNIIKDRTLNEAEVIKVLYGVLGGMIELHTRKKAIGDINP